MFQLLECHWIRARDFTVTLLLRTTRMPSQLLGRASGVAASQTNQKQQELRCITNQKPDDGGR